MISDKRGCYWCKYREGFECKKKVLSLKGQLKKMKWKVSEESLKRPLSECDEGSRGEDIEDYTDNHCMGCLCSFFKRTDRRFVFR